MRYIDLEAAIESLPEDILSNLNMQDSSMLGKSDKQRLKSSGRGNVHWKNVKEYFENFSNRKCWYTESKNPGCLNDVEHFRPKGRALDGERKLLHWYWFLAFNPKNYRLSCHISNRLNNNPLHNATGGKGNHFPLVESGLHATNLTELVNERPMLLDPCNIDDVNLLAFDPDGRPVVAPHFANDETAKSRVEKSKLLLNLDYPSFNEDREQLYNKVKKLVERGDRYVAANMLEPFDDVKTDLLSLMNEKSDYSKAAECYVRCFRSSSWVEDLFLI